MKEERQGRQTILERAAKLMGYKELAAGLSVREELLAAWLEGKAQMPDRFLLPLAELMVKLVAKEGD